MKSIVIIVTFNSRKHIQKCLDSIFTKDKSVSKIFVWDNNSNDNTVETLGSYGSKVEYYKSNKNVGFARAVNKSIDQNPGYDWYFLLNPDTEIIDNSFQDLINIEGYTPDIIGGVTKKYRSGTHGSVVRIPDACTIAFEFTNLLKVFRNNYWHKRFYYLDSPILTSAIVGAVSGSFMGINSKVLNSGLRFDEGYFMYLEDIQFCKDAALIGFKTWFNPTSYIFHVGGASSNNRIRTNYEAWKGSRVHYVDRNFIGIKKNILMMIISLDNLIVKIWRKIRRS